MLVGNTVKLLGHPKAGVGIALVACYGWPPLSLGYRPRSGKPGRTPGSTGYGYNPPGCGATMLGKPSGAPKWAISSEGRHRPGSHSRVVGPLSVQRLDGGGGCGCRELGALIRRRLITGPGPLRYSLWQGRKALGLAKPTERARRLITGLRGPEPFRPF